MMITCYERHTSTIVLTSILCLFHFTVCKDDEPKCADLALARQCIEGDIRYWMLTNCRQSCGLCQGRTCSTIQVQWQLSTISFIRRRFSSMSIREKELLRRQRELLMDTCQKQACDKLLISTPPAFNGTRAIFHLYLILVLKKELLRRLRELMDTCLKQPCDKRLIDTQTFDAWCFSLMFGLSIVID